MSIDLFDIEDDKARGRVEKKLKNLAALLGSQSDASEEERNRQAAEFSKETAQRAILADYANAGEQPVSTGGFLLSRGLLAYGKRVAYEMKKHAHEADKAKAREKAAEQERVDAGSKASADKKLHGRGKAKGGKART